MSYPGTASGVAINMRPWLPALAGLLVAVGLATTAGVLLSAVTPGPGASAPITLRSLSPGAQAAAQVRLTQPAIPLECQPAAWLHVTLAGRCPIARSAAEAVARSVQPTPVNLPIGIGRVTASTRTAAPALAPAPAPTPAATSGAGRQVKESVLAWADVPAGAPFGSPAQGLHALVWVVAVDQPATFSTGCPPRAMANAALIRCGGASRYLVFVDALSGKSRLVTNRP